MPDLNIDKLHTIIMKYCQKYSNAFYLKHCKNAQKVSVLKYYQKAHKVLIKILPKYH